MGGDIGERERRGAIEADRVSEELEEGEDGETVGGEGEEDREAHQSHAVWTQDRHRPRLRSPHDPFRDSQPRSTGPSLSPSQIRCRFCTVKLTWQ